MNQLLSVNCVFVTAIQRLFGPQFFSTILQQLHKSFKENHDLMVLGELEADEEGRDEEAENQYRTRIKNILNCLLHFFLF